MTLPLPPEPQGDAARTALMALIRRRSVLGALEALHHEMGAAFQIPLPGFNPIMLAGPEANRFMLVTAADRLCWRVEGDPVGALFRDGLLVLDGERHDWMRDIMSPALHRRMLDGYVTAIVRQTDRVIADWTTGGPIDMLPQMRRVALLVLMDTLFGVDFAPVVRRMLPAILKTLSYISPGPWLVWRGVPRPGYRAPLRRVDAYLTAVIRQRRQVGGRADDLLGLLIGAGLDDDLIRDQLITMLVAGHDTSTAQLSWVLSLLGRHPLALRRAQGEVDTVLRGTTPAADHLPELEFLGRVIDETLRLYPPIHLGNRLAAVDLEFGGYRIPAGRRVLYSIYLAHRDPAYWPHPRRFDPDCFLPAQRRTRPPFTYLPFGGGRRNCIGFAFAQVEAKVVLARLLQRCRFTPAQQRVRVHMGATLEPRPGVMMRVTPRGSTSGP